MEENKRSIITEEELLNKGDDRSVMEKMMDDLERKSEGEDIIQNEQDNQGDEEKPPVEEKPQGDSPGDTEGEERQKKEQKVEGDKEEEEAGDKSVAEGEERARDPVTGKFVKKTEAEEKAEQDEVEEEEPPLDDWEKEISSLQLRKGASEKSVNALNILKRKAKEEHRARIERERKLQETEAKYKEVEGKAMTPEREKEFEELRNFRRYIDIENDPEFNKEHTEAIARSEGHLMNLLKSWQLPDAMQKYIADSGGPYEFSVSSNPMPNMKNEDGSPMTQAQWWDKNIVSKMSAYPKQRTELQYAMNDLYGKIMGKERAIADARANRENVIKEKIEKAKTAHEDYANRVKSHLPKVLQEVGLTDLTEKEIPAHATPEQKAQIEEHNKTFKEGQELVRRYATSNTPEDRVESAIWATYGKLMANKEKGNLTKQIDTLKAQNAKLVAQIADFKKSGKTITHSSAPADKKLQGSPSTNESPSTRMEKAMAARNL